MAETKGSTKQDMGRADAREAQGCSDWERAYQMGRRAFYERYTDTIRACPENYCLADGGPGKWRLYRDGAMRAYWPAIERVIAEWGQGSTSDALADEIGRALPDGPR
jgi:hypothetical protein